MHADADRRSVPVVCEYVPLFFFLKLSNVFFSAAPTFVPEKRTRRRVRVAHLEELRRTQAMDRNTYFNSAFGGESSERAVGN